MTPQRFMSPRDFAEDFERMGPQDVQVLVLYLAAHCHEAVLNNGKMIRDGLDYCDWLHQIADALQKMQQKRDPIAQRIAAAAFCHVCGHIHQEAGECGKDMGGAGVCRCAQAVSA